MDLNGFVINWSQVEGKKWNEQCLLTCSGIIIQQPKKHNLLVSTNYMPSLHGQIVFEILLLLLQFYFQIYHVKQSHTF